jgi:hypothetical protein
MTAPHWRMVAGYTAARALPALASLATTALCVQLLSAQDYAVFSLTALPAAVLAGFAGAACGPALLRFALELSDRATRQALLALPLLYGALGFGLAMAYLAWRDGLTTAAWWAALSIPAMVLIDARRNAFIAEGKVAQVFKLDSARALLALALTAALLLAWAATPVAPLAATALAALAALLLVANPARAPAKPQGRAIDQAYLAHGLALALWLAALLALSLAERALVAEHLGLADSGRYAAQADIVNALFAAMGGALAAAMMPSYLSSVAHRNAVAQGQLLLYALGAVGALAALCLGLGWALRALRTVIGEPRLLQSLVGDAATGAWLLAAAAVWTGAGFVQKPVELGGASRHLVFAMLGALLVFGLLGPWAVRDFGAPGVAAAKLAAGVVFLLWVAAAGRRSR